MKARPLNRKEKIKFSNANGNNDPELQNAYQQFLQYIADGLETVSFIPSNMSPCDFIANSSEARPLISNTIDEILNNYNSPLYNYTLLYMSQNGLTQKDVADDVIELACNDTPTIPDASSTPQNDFTGTVLEGINSPQEFAQQFDEYFIAEYLYNNGDCNGNVSPNNPNLNALVMGLKNEAYSIGGQEYINAVIAYQPNLSLLKNLMTGYCQGIPNMGDDDLGTPPTIQGCTDPTASNFQPTAVFDDGSCVYNESEIGDCDELELENAQLEQEVNFLQNNQDFLINQTQEIADYFQNENQELEEDNQNLQQENVQLNEILTDYAAEINDLQEVYQYTLMEWSQTLIAVEDFANQAGINAVINNSQNVYNVLQSLQLQGSVSQDDINDLENQLNQSYMEIASLVTDLTDLQSELAQSQNSTQSYEVLIDNLQAQLENMMNALEVSNANTESLETIIQGLQDELDECNNLEELDGIVDDYNVLLAEFNVIKNQMSSLLNNNVKPKPIKPINKQVKFRKK
tara:strand:+ start:101 stop:1651 length:1551 start_codon:yes stop_codon:yes gene_type:complete